MTTHVTPILTAESAPVKMRGVMAKKKTPVETPEEWLTAQQVAERLTEQHSFTVKLSRVRAWLGRELFGADQRLNEGSIIPYYEVKASALENFVLPKPGPKSKESS